MRISVFLSLFLALFCIIFLTSCSENEDGKTQDIQEYDPENPVLVMVGKFRIDKKYFDTSLRLLPPGLFEIYSSPKRYRDFLSEIVIQEIYYKEGIHRGYDTKPGYVSMIEAARRAGLIEYALEKEVLKDFSLDDEYLEGVYKQNPTRFQLPNGTVLPFEDVKNRILRNVLRDKMGECLTSSGEKLEKRFAVRYHLEFLKPGNEKSNKPVVESGIMTWTPMDFAQKAADAGMLKTLIKYEGRVNTLKRLVWERLFHDNALADKIDREDEFVRRMNILSHYLLATFTKNEVIGEDIIADYKEAMAYYDLHHDSFVDFTGKLLPFADVQEKAIELATIQKRNDVLANLSKSIARNRFEPVFFNEHCDKLWGNNKSKE